MSVKSSAECLEHVPKKYSKKVAIKLNSNGERHWNTSRFEDYQCPKDITKRKTQQPYVKIWEGKLGIKSQNLPVDWDFGSFSSTSHNTFF